MKERRGKKHEQLPPSDTPPAAVSRQLSALEAQYAAEKAARLQLQHRLQVLRCCAS